MAFDQILSTIMGLATIFGSGIGLVLTGVLVVALILWGLDRAQGFLGRGAPSAQ